MGGDEFIAMLIASKAELTRRLENFKKYTYEWKGTYIDEISVSVGAASLRDNPGIDINTLCKIADDNMYLAKKEYYKDTGFDRRLDR